MTTFEEITIHVPDGQQHRINEIAASRIGSIIKTANTDGSDCQRYRVMNTRTELLPHSDMRHIVASVVPLRRASRQDIELNVLVMKHITKYQDAYARTKQEIAERTVRGKDCNAQEIQLLILSQQIEAIRSLETDLFNWEVQV